MPTSTTIRRTTFFMDPPRESGRAEDLAEACGNRTHRSRVPPAPNGFEVRAGHQPRGASVERTRAIVSQTARRSDCADSPLGSPGDVPGRADVAAAHEQERACVAAAGQADDRVVVLAVVGHEG